MPHPGLFPARHSGAPAEELQSASSSRALFITNCAICRTQLHWNPGRPTSNWHKPWAVRLSREQRILGKRAGPLSQGNHFGQVMQQLRFADVDEDLLCARLPLRASAYVSSVWPLHQPFREIDRPHFTDGGVGLREVSSHAQGQIQWWKSQDFYPSLPASGACDVCRREGIWWCLPLSCFLTQ